MYQGYNYYPYQNYQVFPQDVSKGGFNGLFRRGNNLIGDGIKPKFNWSNFLSNTQKTLNVVNQAIPIFYQIKPIWNNAKTMFRIMGALKDDDSSSKQNKETYTNLEKKESVHYNNDNQPQFFI